MQKIYLAKDPIDANILKELLQERDIEAAVQDERLFAARFDLNLRWIRRMFPWIILSGTGSAASVHYKQIQLTSL